MSNFIPEGELIKRAMTFILEELESKPESNRKRLVDEASMRFNLSPLESNALYNIIKEEKPA